MIDVFAADEQSGDPVDTSRWVRLAQAVLDAEGVTSDAELSMLFVDEPAMADLNGRFRGIDAPTDVLAFPIDDDLALAGPSAGAGAAPPGPPPSPPPQAPVLLGDVVVCPTVARRQAPAHAGTYDQEMALLVVHGILHLLGMDHLDEAEAAAMEQRERDLLGRFQR